MRLLFNSLLVFLFATVVTEAQISLSVENAEIRRGEDYMDTINIRGDFDNAASGSIEIIFSYNSNVILINSITQPSNTFLKEPELTDFVFVPLDNSTFAVKAQEFTKKSGELFGLVVEGLAGSDSLTNLKPEKIIINNAVVTASQLNGGEIKVTGNPVFKVLPEGMGQNYPNPFYTETRLRFGIKKKTKVQFLLYSNAGQLIRDSYKSDDFVHMEFRDKNKQVINVDKNTELEAGSYILKITPLIWEFSSGQYYLIMVTDHGTRTKSIMYFK